MAIQLIYHTKESALGGVSPFDTTILQIVRNKDICIACPYFTLDYLRRITSQCKSWRMITDVEEWLASQPKIERQDIQNFILEHHKEIHHLEGIHSKVVISEDKALIGSANFTYHGITRRTEMSVLFDKEPQVDETLTWFNNLWAQSSWVNTYELSELMKSQPLDPLPTKAKSKITLTSQALPISSRLQPIQTRQRIGTLTIEFIEANLETIFIAYSFVYIQNAIDALNQVFSADAVIIQPYQQEKAFSATERTLELYKRISGRVGIPILFTPQGRMSEQGQFFEYSGQLLHILEEKDIPMIEQNLEMRKWVLAGDEKLYAKKNILVVSRPIVQLRQRLPVSVATNIRNEGQEEPVKAVAIPAPKLIDPSYCDILEEQK